MTIINEDLARRNKENMSFSDYAPGSATAEYRQIVADATAKVEAAKERVSPEGQDRLDNLLARFCSKQADWINRRNASGANHVSVMVAGPSNYNMRQHEKWLAKESKLWAEYDEFSDIDSQISKIINGDKIIKTEDGDALEKLQDKLSKALEEHAAYKEHNAKARKEKKPEDILPAYVLTNSNGRIRSIRQRVEQLERLQQQVTTELVVGEVRIVDNVPDNRVQLFFDGKPSAEIRDKLKSNGFRWAPSIGAWQRHRSTNAQQLAKQIARQTNEI